MTHEEKVAYLSRNLGPLGIGQYTIAPPIYRFLWRLGIEVPPPLFASFWPLATFMAVGFAVFWMILMWFIVWPLRSPVSLAIAAAFAGLLFGVIMATYYRWRAQKLGLPRWEDYPTS